MMFNPLDPHEDEPTPTIKVWEDPPPLPRWIQIPAGIFLFLVSLLSTIGAIATFLLTAPSLFIKISIGTPILAVCLWIMGKSIRLMFGWRRDSWLFSPKEVRFWAAIILTLQLCGFLIGEHHWYEAVFLAPLAIYLCFRLYKWARRRDEK